ncbi:small subunit ribosomal protein S3e [Nematocida sp. AWRm77]|nr:small subunit ribosomal protein S3e [Nematocida sp. AWRm77]
MNTTKLERRKERNQRMEVDLKIVKQGIMYAELNEFFEKHLINDGYAGMDYKPFGPCLEITLKLGKTSGLLENEKLRIKQMISMIRMRFPELREEGSVAIYIEQVKNRALNPQIQADLIREKLSTQIPVRRAVSGALRTIMEGGAAGAQVIVSGKLRGQRAKSYKVTSGILLHSGTIARDYVKKAQSIVLLRQGVLGIKVTITLAHDPEGLRGTPVLHPNKIQIFSQDEINQRRKASSTHKTFKKPVA